jgi:ubiquinone/menaquinone biosynthesis C-methylase UbiE
MAAAITPAASLVGAMWFYAETVFRPAQVLKRLGLYTPRVIGMEPHKLDRPGLGPRFSLEHQTPVLLNRGTEHDHLVDEFNKMAEVYSEFVRPFSEPIFEEGLAIIKRYLQPDWRVLDAGCGPGRELQQVARLVPEGEVVGIDLAAGMVNTAHRAARSFGLKGCAFFQSDVGDLPAVFEDQFDLAYSCLAHHHYPDPPTASKSIFHALRPGGLYCVIDPGPAWYNAISAPLAKLADPGWIGFHTPEEFSALLRNAGFINTAWFEILPGFGVAAGQKPLP